MSRDKTPKSHRTARERANDLLSYGMGVMAVIFALGPVFEASNAKFVAYVSEYYGQGFAGFASIFLFLLLALVIFSAATLIIHTAAVIFEGRAKLFSMIRKL